MHKFNTVYKITNLINQKIYIGIHSTNILDDGYMGSSRKLKEDIKILGKNNFIKEILFIFDNVEEMFNKEIELVDKEFIKRKDVYNIATGGKVPLSTGLVSVKDSKGKCYKVSKDDPRYLNGEFVSIGKGTFLAKDTEGNNYRICKTDPRYISGELTAFSKGKPKNENWLKAINKYWKGYKRTKEEIEKVCNAQQEGKRKRYLVRRPAYKLCYKIFNGIGVNFLFCSMREMKKILNIDFGTIKKYKDTNVSIFSGKWKGFKIITGYDLI